MTAYEEWEIHERKNFGKTAVWHREPPANYLKTMRTRPFAVDWIQTSGDKEKVYFILKWMKRNKKKISEQYNSPRTKARCSDILSHKEKWVWSVLRGWHQTHVDGGSFGSAHRRLD